MQGAVITRGNFIPFILKNQKFRLENRMDGVIPFEKLQKKLTVIVATFLLKGGLYLYGGSLFQISETVP